MGAEQLKERPLVAFLGPSLPAVEARRLVPEVELLPPICQGDLSTVVQRAKPSGVLIVDGEFGQSLSVWHKEILHALDLGVRVVGASSMGALRAAEMDRYGMEGVGEIYAYYRDGWLTSDADVALLYGDAEDGYEALTWPLVNVRATLRVLENDGALSEQEGEAVLEAAEALHFTKRNEHTLAAELASRGMAGSRARDLAAVLAERYVDQKARDAVAGFEHLARLSEIERPVGEVPLHRDGRGFQPLLWSDVSIHRRAGSLRRYQFVADVALHHPNFESLLERAINRYLVAHLAWDLGVEPDQAELDDERTRILTRLEVADDAFDEWLTANDLDADGFAELVRQEAANRRLRRWLLDGRLYERARRVVIEQLQLDGEYPAAADAAARRRAMADSRPTPPYPRDEKSVFDLLVRQMAISGWKPRSDLARFADDQGFDGVAALIVALSDSASANIELQERRRRISKMLGFDVAGLAPGQAAAPPPLPPAATRAHGLLEAHQVTQVLLTAVELGVPAALVDGPATTEDVAAATRTNIARLERLLRALQAAKVVTLENGGWALTPEGRALAPSAPGDEDTLAAYAEHVRAAVFPAWAGLADVIRGAEPPGYPADEVSDRLISAATVGLGFVDAVANALELPPGARVADIGGGLGHTAEALVGARPDISVVLVELPATAERAAARLEGIGLASTIGVIPYVGQRRLEQPVDRCLLARVVVTLPEADAVDLLRFARRSLAPDGRLEVIDLEADGTPGAAFGDLLNLARSGGGVRSPEQWRELSGRAGLRLTRRRPIVSPFVHLSFERDTEARKEEAA